MQKSVRAGDQGTYNCYCSQKEGVQLLDISSVPCITLNRIPYQSNSATPPRGGLSRVGRGLLLPTVGCVTVAHCASRGPQRLRRFDIDHHPMAPDSRYLSLHQPQMPRLRASTQYSTNLDQEVDMYTMVDTKTLNPVVSTLSPSRYSMSTLLPLLDWLCEYVVIGGDHAIRPACGERAILLDPCKHSPSDCTTLQARYAPGQSGVGSALTDRGAAVQQIKWQETLRNSHSGIKSREE